MRPPGGGWTTSGPVSGSDCRECFTAEAQSRRGARSGWEWCPPADSKPMSCINVSSGARRPSAPPRLRGEIRGLDVTTASREGQTLAGGSLLVRYVNFVKLPHTLFALPFALLGVLQASVEG